jgi:hypothetical protein
MFGRLQSTPLKEISSSKFKTPSFYNRVSCLCLHPILCFVYIPVNSISPLGIKISSLKGYWLRVILTFSRVAVLRTLLLINVWDVTVDDLLIFIFFVNRWSRFPQKLHYSLDDIHVHYLFLIKLISTYCGTNISMVVLVYWNYHMIWLYFVVLMIFQLDRQDSFLM